MVRCGVQCGLDVLSGVEHNKVYSQGTVYSKLTPSQKNFDIGQSQIDACTCSPEGTN